MVRPNRAVIEKYINRDALNKRSGGDAESMERGPVRMGAIGGILQ